MLILTRKSDESIVIGNDIEVKVLRVQGGQVHIGIDAPREISVYRQEIFDQIKKENLKAVQKASKRSFEDNLSNLSGLFFGSGSDDKKKAPATKPKSKTKGKSSK